MDKTEYYMLKSDSSIRMYLNERAIELKRKELEQAFPAQPIQVSKQGDFIWFLQAREDPTKERTWMFGIWEFMDCNCRFVPSL